MKILIAEDCKYTQKIIYLHLHKHGFETLICPNGKQAVEKLAAHPDVALILSDIVMPEMNGLEFLKAVKSNDATKQIPVAMLTGKNDAETVRAAVQLGCCGYIVKPINPGIMMETVRSILKLEEDWDLHNSKGVYTSRRRLH